MESNKAWQVAVGQVIGEIAKLKARSEYEHSLLSYLGKKLASNIFPVDELGI